ncbi:hypothetical protein TeGR_g3569 [Tetraparma gracilis]|uniref:ABC transporter domain-containing protein n=1 Tax=Tetraparma gracilis TaxID=2962635 RepID=A0ABQ6NBG7_9STRA|nr:hypothetical protein TeGR_g3569 [Tetraparma gracilis]
MSALLRFLFFAMIFPPTHSQPGGGGGPGGGNGAMAAVAQQCAPDVQSLCGGFAMINPQKAMECLQTAYSCNMDGTGSNCDSVGTLSSNCLDALSSINMDDIPTPPDIPHNGPNNGVGCFADVARLCTPTERQNFELMHECLDANYDALSSSCKESMEKRQENIAKRIPSHFLQVQDKGITQAITAVSIAVLFIPLLCAAYVFKKSRDIYDAMYAPDVFASAARRAPAAPQTEAQLHLSMHNVSYFVKEKQILRNVTCSFKPGTLTAIMGPSGSGKTTLLNLVSGHMSVGRVTGSRLLNRSPLPSSSYDSFMRSQAYVEQEDNLLFPTLTVWETLCFAALLRLPESSPIGDKLARALAVLREVGLGEAADSPVGGPSLKGISGGQKRRLSIAIELLRSPASLICDEPTSGLDATTSLQLIQSLKLLAKQHSRTVVTTIHQPRSEIFELFDNVVLLGKGGHVIYAGPAKNNMVTHVHLPDYDNPADFVIDAMGLNDHEPAGARAASPTSEGGGMSSGGRAMGRLMGKLQDKAMGARRKAHGYAVVGGGDDGDEGDDEALNEGGGRPTFMIADDDDEQDEEAPGTPARARGSSGGGNISAVTPGGTAELARKYTQSAYYRQQYDDIFAVESGGANGTTIPEPQKPIGTKNQVVYLFARRFMRLNNDPVRTLKQWFSMFCIGGVISYAFSYETSTPNKPYQTFMLLFSVSSVAMIMEYLILVPEYFDERPIFVSERKRNVVSNHPYIITTGLTEVPRAVLHSTLMILVSYIFHDLNPDPTNITFCVVCLMCGSVSWQSVICAVCCMFSDAKYAYDLLFMVLGGGTLFGGMLVKLKDIPALFKPIYYLSVTAITQRALVANDFICCYLTATCGEVSLSGNATQGMDLFGDGDMGGVCPPELVCSPSSSSPSCAGAGLFGS